MIWIGGLPNPVKLQRIVSRKVGKETYYKWQLTIPPKDIERLGWQAGQEVVPEVKGKELRLRSAPAPIATNEPGRLSD